MSRGIQISPMAFRERHTHTQPTQFKFAEIRDLDATGGELATKISQEPQEKAE